MDEYIEGDMDDRPFKLGTKEWVIFISVVVLVLAMGTYFAGGKSEPVKKTAIQILTESNISFMQQIGTLSEQKKDLVIQRNSLEEQIKNRDSAIDQYSSKIDENAAKIENLTLNK